MSLGLTPQGRDFSRDEEVLLLGSSPDYTMVDDSIENLFRTKKSATPFFIKKRYDAPCCAFLWFVSIAVVQQSYDPIMQREWISRSRYVMQGSFQDLNFLNPFDFSKMRIGDPEIISFLEDVALLIYHLVRSRSMVDYTMALVTFLKLRCRSSLVLKLKECDLRKFIAALDDKDPTPVVEMQGLEENLHSAREMLDYWPRLKTSPMWKKTNAVVMYVVALSLMDERLTTAKGLKVADVYYKSRASFTGDFTYSILDMILFLCERGFQIAKTGNVDVMFHSGESYDRWYSDAMELQEDSRYLSNPIAHNLDIHKFQTRLNQCIEKGESMYKWSCELDRAAKTSLGGLLGQLRASRAQCVHRMLAQKTRKAPFGILVQGHSSVGKSSFTNVLHYFYGALFDKDVSLGKRYTRSPGEKHWNNFTSDQWSLLIDDIGFENPLIQMTLPAGLGEVVQVMNNCPMMPEQASLEMKGQTPLLVDLCVATTNSPELHAHHYYAYPLAASRRLPYHVHVRPKHDLIKNGVFLDSSKITPPDNDYPDLWEISVFGIEPTQKRLAQSDAPGDIPTMVGIQYPIPDMQDVGMGEFLSWLGPKMLEHDRVQTLVADSEVAMMAVQICKTCFQVRKNCVCAHPVLSAKYIELQGLTTLVFTQFVAGCCFSLGSWFVSLSLSKTLIWFAMHTPYLRNLLTSFNEWCSLEFQQFLDVRRLALVSCGRKVTKKLCTPASLILISSVLIVALVAYYGRKSDDIVYEGAISSQFVRPVPKTMEHESCWIRPTYTPTAYDFSRESASWVGLTSEQIISILARNVVILRVEYGIRARTCNLTGIGGDLYITTNHTVPDCSKTNRARVLTEPEGTSINSNVSFVLSESDIRRFPDRDLAIIRIRCLPPKRKIFQLFHQEKLSVARGEAMYVSRKPDGQVFTPGVKAVRHEDHDLPDLGLRSRWIGTANDRTFDGMCGSPLFMCVPGGVIILGIHEFSFKADMFQAGSIPVTREWLEAQIDDSKLFEPSTPMFDAPSADPVVISSLHKKSPINYLNGAKGNVLGSIEGFRTDPKSRVEKSIFCDDIEALGFPLKYGKPIMKGYKPWARAISNLTQADCGMSNYDLDMCRDALLSRWMTLTPKGEIGSLCMYDVFTAVNGVAGLRFVDLINRNTSAGSPWKKSKKHFAVHVEPCDGLTDPIEFTSEITDRVFERLEAYLNGQRTHPVFVASLKDEARKFSKIETSNTRVFMGAPVDFTLCMRIVLLSFVRVVQKNKFIFESAPGTEAQSIDWDWIARYITQHGSNRMIFGDFQDYDMSMRAPLIEAAFEVIALFHEKNGCSPEHVKLIRGIGQDVAFALIDFHGDLIEVFGKNPSGQALTVIINGIVNCIYMRFCYMKSNPKGDVHSFDANVALMTYGDDNGMGVSDRAPWFNHTSIQSNLADIGVIYTMAEKGSESVPYIDFKEGSFLKRNWRWEPELEAYVGPLEVDSIYKMLQIGVSSDHITREEHMMEKVRSANDEWFWHGREKFEEWRKILIDLIYKHKLVPYLRTKNLPTWEQLCQRYHDNSDRFRKSVVAPSFVDEGLILQGRQDYDVINKNGSQLCHAVGCRKHKTLFLSHNGLFCYTHLHVIDRIREQLALAKLEGATTAEMIARNEEFRFRKNTDQYITAGHAHYVCKLEFPGIVLQGLDQCTQIPPEYVYIMPFTIESASFFVFVCSVCIVTCSFEFGKAICVGDWRKATLTCFACYHILLFMSHAVWVWNEPGIPIDQYHSRV